MSDDPRFALMARQPDGDWVVVRRFESIDQAARWFDPNGPGARAALGRLPFLLSMVMGFVVGIAIGALAHYVGVV